MRPAGPLLLLLVAAAAADSSPATPAPTDLADVGNATIILDNVNGTVFIDSDNHTVFMDDHNRTIILDDLLEDGNETVIIDGEHEPIVRKKRTFGDIVFRGLADVLGYSVARKSPQVVFPPPLAPVPGIDTPLLVVPAAAVAYPVAPQAAPAAPAPPPCGAGRAAPAPCRAAKPAPPPAPKAAPPCPKPRAAPRPKPKPKPKPAPPPPPPCGQPRANPTTPSPCAPAPAKQAPPAKQQADSNLETITSNFQLNFNFNRGPATQAPAAADEAEPAQEEQAEEQEQFVPIAIQPQAAKLPAEEPRNPRVYVDAYVVRNGVPQRVDAVDAKRLNPQNLASDDDVLVYDEEEPQPEQVDTQLDNDDYDDVQETRDQDNTIREFGNVVDRFWEKKKMMRRTHKMNAPGVPVDHYHSVHFGDRDLDDDMRLRGESHQNLQRERPHPNRIPIAIPEDDDFEMTTTTEDPRNSLKPRVLPPTEHNPNQIDTITVRVPPIYREKHPRKLHRGSHEVYDYDETTVNYGMSSREDTEGDNSAYIMYTERPIRRRRRRRKHSRKTRSTDEEKEEYKTDDEFDYFGKKVPVSEAEKYFMELTVPPPTRDADVLRHEKPVASGYFLDDHERLRDDPSQRLKDDPSQRLKDDPSERLRDDPSERIRDDPSDRISDEKERVDSSERIDDRERADDKERIRADSEKEDDDGEVDERERSDQLSPNARITESAYQNKYLRATNVQVDDPRPDAAKRKTGKSGKA